MCKVNRCGRFDLCMIAVSLLAKGVDWNAWVCGFNSRPSGLPSCEGSGLKRYIPNLFGDALVVSLLAKGVDWNILSKVMLESIIVSLLAKGVDWNIRNLPPWIPFRLSPFLRREWIETLHGKHAPFHMPRLPSCEGSGLKQPPQYAYHGLISLPSCEGSGLKHFG